jgi:ATP-dependent exoDNAse (exonuclease V) beta subunit
LVFLRRDGAPARAFRRDESEFPTSIIGIGRRRSPTKPLILQCTKSWYDCLPALRRASSVSTSRDFAGELPGVTVSAPTVSSPSAYHHRTFALVENATVMGRRVLWRFGSGRQEARLRSVQLAQIASTYPNRERFLTELTLDPPTASGGEAGVPLLDEDYLILSTIHSAKGQEWNSVFVLNCVDGCIPSDLATASTPEIEEERRLLYVAMTRAKDHLHLIVPQRFYAHQQRNNGDRHMYALRTRFIPDAITDHFEQCAWPVPTRESGFPTAAPLKTVPIGARLKQMWR